jgi:hypothetical protein
VGVGDGLNDGEAEPGAVGTGPTLRVESLEGLKEAREFTRGDERAGVGDGQQGASRLATSCDFDPPAGEVVSDRVRDEVGGEPLEQNRIADRDRGLE